MLWRRAAPSPVVPPSAPVPDADRLRLAALQASWARGRWVARRRVALRWLVWIGTRYLMPALAISGVAAWLWLGPLQAEENPVQQLLRWAGQQVSPDAAPPILPPAAEVTDASLSEQADVALVQTHNPEGDPLEPSPSLKLETRWPSPTLNPPDALSAAPASAEPDLPPPLKPENWLHSKEP